MKNYSNVLLVYTIIAACTFTFSSCTHGEKVKEYEPPFFLGEGMIYRSKIFKVERPSTIPFPVKMNDKYEYSRDTHGSHMEHSTEPVFDFAKPITEDLGAVKVGSKWGYIRILPDKTKGFEFVISPRFESAEPFSEGLAAVKVDNKYGYIDSKGKMAIEPEFLSAHYFSGGTAVVEGEEGWIFINKRGEIEFNGIYECAESFSTVYTLKDGRYEDDYDKTLAPVKIKGKWGYINLKGRIVIEPAFDEAWAFEYDGRAAVKSKDKWKYIDTKGRFIGNVDR